MSVSIEKQVGAALARLLAASGLDPTSLGRRLGLPPRDLERLLAGEDALDLDRLQRVLVALGHSPSRFLADLYAAPDPAPPPVTPPAERPLDREEIERLVHDLRVGIRTLVQLMEDQGPGPMVAAGDPDHDLTP